MEQTRNTYNISVFVVNGKNYNETGSMAVEWIQAIRANAHWQALCAPQSIEFQGRRIDYSMRTEAY